MAFLNSLDFKTEMKRFSATINDYLTATRSCVLILIKDSLKQVWYFAGSQGVSCPSSRWGYWCYTYECCRSLCFFRKRNPGLFWQKTYDVFAHEGYHDESVRSNYLWTLYQGVYALFIFGFPIQLVFALAGTNSLRLIRHWFILSLRA